jgi:hypothetical protein
MEEIETEFLLLKPVNQHKYIVYYKSNIKCIGVFAMDVDGYYYFWPNDADGSWASYELRIIADALDAINKPHNDNVKAYFENNGRH